MTKAQEAMEAYNKLSKSDKCLVDKAIESAYPRRPGEFGADPTLAQQNRQEWLANVMEFFVQPEALQRLRDNEVQRQANLAASGVKDYVGCLNAESKESPAQTLPKCTKANPCIEI